MLDRQLDAIRLDLVRPDALLRPALLGLVTGILGGGLIIVFRLVVEGTQAAMPEHRENFEGPPVVASALSSDPAASRFDLQAIPADRLDLAPVTMQATPHEALDLMRSRGVAALYVTLTLAPADPIEGVLTEG